MQTAFQRSTGCHSVSQQQRGIAGVHLHGSATRKVLPRCTIVTTSQGSATRVVEAPTSTSHYDTQRTGSPDMSTSTGQEQEVYQWLRHWYPVGSLGELDERRPHNITIFGKDLVLWRDNKGAWHAFEDACPHRLAPLSEGRVEKDGTLLCAYHAWRFDGSGHCVAIPQVKDETERKTALSSPRSCVKAYPTRVEHGLIFVWPDPSPTNFQDSSQEPPLVCEEVVDPTLAGRVSAPSWRTAELPYGHTYFLENVVDPAHVPVSHHGIVGNRYTDPKAIEFNVERPVSFQGGFAMSAESRTFGNKPSKTITDFRPPCLVKITSDKPDGAKTILMLYTTPSRPGYTRHVGSQIFVESPAGKRSAGFAFFGMPMPTWLNHALGAFFLNQDGVFLHWQERIASRPPHKDKPVASKYYLPTTSDRMVMALRQWLERHSPDGLPFTGAYASGVVPEVERDASKLFDTYHSHTKNCKSCMGALTNLRKGVVAAWAAAAVSAITASVAWAQDAAARAAAAGVASGLPLPPLPSILGFVLALASVGAVLVMRKLIEIMHVVPFSHADNH